jgi:hypothetical protein
MGSQQEFKGAWLATPDHISLSLMVDRQAVLAPPETKLKSSRGACLRGLPAKAVERDRDCAQDQESIAAT